MMGCGCLQWAEGSLLRSSTVKTTSLRPRPRAVIVSVCNDNFDTDSSSISSGRKDEAIKGSGTTARARRLLRIREEKQQREYDRLNNYPSWARVLENACKDDAELRAVLGDSIGNPELMRKRVQDRVRKKGRDFQKSKTGSVLAFKVTFRE